VPRLEKENRYPQHVVGRKKSVPLMELSGQLLYNRRNVLDCFEELVAYPYMYMYIYMKRLNTKEV